MLKDSYGRKFKPPLSKKNETRADNFGANMAKPPAFSVAAEYRSVTVCMENEDGREFLVRVTSEGLEFFHPNRDTGHPDGNPIVKTAAQVFEWIQEDRPSEHGKEFGKRAAFAKKPPARSEGSASLGLSGILGKKAGAAQSD